MTEEIVEIVVIAHEGRDIEGYGSRAHGESFFLPADFANKLLKQQPGAFILPSKKNKTQKDVEVSDAN